MFNMSNKKVKENLNEDDKVLQGRKALEQICIEQVNSSSSIVKALKPEILRLRKAGVPLSTIAEKLCSAGIKVSKQLICTLVPLDKVKVQKGKKVLNESSEKVISGNNGVKEKLHQKTVEVTKAATVVTQPVQQDSKPSFKVPDLSTLPPELTSIPGFDPASSKSVEFIDENGDPKIYLEGRIYPGMRKSTGFNMHKPAAEKI